MAHAAVGNDQCLTLLGLGTQYPNPTHNFIAIGYGPNSKYGYLGTIDALKCASGQVDVQVSSTTLSKVLQSDAQYSFGDQRKVAEGSGGDQSLKANGPCQGGGSIGLTGKLSFGITPKLEASFQWFKLQSASFSVTGAASASVTLDANATTGCELHQTLGQADLGTFEATIGPVPVVIVLHAATELDAKVSASAHAHAGITATGRSPAASTTATAGFTRVSTRSR